MRTRLPCVSLSRDHQTHNLQHYFISRYISPGEIDRLCHKHVLTHLKTHGLVQTAVAMNSQTVVFRYYYGSGDTIRWYASSCWGKMAMCQSIPFLAAKVVERRFCSERPLGWADRVNCKNDLKLNYSPLGNFSARLQCVSKTKYVRLWLIRHAESLRHAVSIWFDIELCICFD